MPRSASCSSSFAGRQPSIVPAVDADIIVLSPSSDDLARFGNAWSGAAGPSVRPIDLATFAPDDASQLGRDRRIAGARAILVALPGAIDRWRDAIAAVAAFAGANTIAFAIITTDDLGEAPSGLVTNLPPSTLRRLNKLYRHASGNAARNVLTQFALAAGLTIPLGLDDPAAERSPRRGWEASGPGRPDLVEDAA